MSGRNSTNPAVSLVPGAGGIRDLTQQDGCKTQDGRMTKKMSRKTWNALSRATVFRHSAVLSLTAVRILLRKLPIFSSGSPTTAGGIHRVDLFS